MSEPTIVPVDDEHADAAVGLLQPFFEEEGFFGDRAAISANLEALRRASQKDAWPSKSC